MGRNAFASGMLPGLGGVAYQLLRAQPEHDLPSILKYRSRWSSHGGPDFVGAGKLAVIGEIRRCELFTKELGFPFALPRSRPLRPKCNEALSRDLWPLDPFESAPMRATSSGMSYCILCAIRLPLKIKGLAELLSGKTGRNSLTLKKLLGGIFREATLGKIHKHARTASKTQRKNRLTATYKRRFSRMSHFDPRIITSNQTRSATQSWSA
jgi:hypothetical protein